jgi:uncharacterized protein (DUF488 family)
MGFHSDLHTLRTGGPSRFYPGPTPLAGTVNLASGHAAMKIYTIGYGGRAPRDFLALLTHHGVRAIVDVRIRPDRASMGSYVRARSAEKGVERLLADRGISYHPILELGNPFLELEDWRTAYAQLLRQSGDLLVARLDGLPTPFCLLCAEKRAEDCHRKMIAEFLSSSRGWAVQHIE